MLKSISIASQVSEANIPFPETLLVSTDEVDEALVANTRAPEAMIMPNEAIEAMIPNIVLCFMV